MRTRRLSALRLLAALALLALSACAADNLPDYIQLGPLRVLALKADHPEVDPTAATLITITPVVSDLNSGRTLSYSVVGCIDPGVGYGATPSCTGVPGTATLASGSIPAVGTALKTNTGNAPAFTLTVPATILANRNPADTFNGVAYLVIYTLSAKGNAGATGADGQDAQVVAFKRIIASKRPLKNSNPALSGISVGSQSLSAFLAGLTYPYAGATPSLAPTLSAGSTESYPQLNADGTQSTLTETLTTTWFISDGKMTYYRTNGTDPDGWTPPASAPLNSAGASRGMVFVAVTRDGRGGEDFLQVER